MLTGVAAERKDPEYDAIEVKPTHRVVVIEGIYLAMSTPEPWNEGAEQFDEIHLLTISETVARQRIISRHLQTGLAKDEDAAAHRADMNDLPNGLGMLENLSADHITSRIPSIDEIEFAS